MLVDKLTRDVALALFELRRGGGRVGKRGQVSESKMTCAHGCFHSYDTQQQQQNYNFVQPV